MMDSTVDARGLSCPQPVLMTRNAIKKGGKGRIEVLVDTETSRDNCTRVAQKAGWQVEAIQEGEEYRLLLSKPQVGSGVR